MNSFQNQFGNAALWRASKFDRRQPPYSGGNETRTLLRVTAACGNAKVAS
jgi:hypothetical protein